ncbi:MAG: signal peptidase I [Candidatus Micrarchaeia archaeon]|jgi:signal peptidase I
MKKISASKKSKAGAFTDIKKIALAAVAVALFIVCATTKTPAVNAFDGPDALEPAFEQTAAATIAPNETAACVTSIEERTVRGDSMTGIFSNGQTVRVQFGYYGCNEPSIGDVVLVHFAGDTNPLIKIIKATPGDSFSLSKASCGWNIIVNGQVLQNSFGTDYCIGYSGYKMLSLYVNSYGGVIPQDAYLVLGNLVGGSTDSTRFGLTSKNSLLGKVEKPKKTL